MVKKIIGLQLFLSFLFLFNGSLIAQSADSSSVEWIEIYFNMPGDDTVAIDGNMLNDEAYYNEFTQLFGDDGDTPNSDKARFHRGKRYFEENEFYVNTTKVELYFVPIKRDRTKPSIVARLNELILEADEDVNFLAFAITPNIEMSQSMWVRSFSDEIKLQGLARQLREGL